MNTIILISVFLAPTLPKEKITLENNPIAFIANMKAIDKPWLTLYKIESNMAQEKYEKWLKDNGNKLKKLLIEKYPKAKNNLDLWMIDLDDNNNFIFEIDLKYHNMSACLFDFYRHLLENKDLNWD